MNTRIRKKLVRQGHAFAQPEVELPDRPFFTWFWEDVLGYSSEEYRRRFWREAYQHGYTIGPMPKTFGTRMGTTVYGFEKEIGEILVRSVLIGVPVIFFTLIHLAIRRYLRRLRRPTYYERERDRRLDLGQQRRSILHRATHNSKPTLDAIRAAWNGARHSPEGALRLGGLLEDLECFVNNSAKGNAVTGYRGRYGGIKRFLQEKAPDLFEHYAALMRYKSIARRFRQACNVEDPIPANALLPLENQEIRPLPTKAKPTNSARDTKGQPANSAKVPQENLVNSTKVQLKNSATAAKGQPANSATTAKNQTTSASISNGTRAKQTTDDCLIWSDQKLLVDGIWFPKLDFEVEEAARVTALRILRKCANSVISLEAALALEIDPDCIETTRKQSRSDKARAKKNSGPIKSSVSGRVRAWLRKRQVA